jgi:hypothetical protein
VQEKFRADDDPLSILICTDAASEGLDLQSCNTLINYDIPWNPMRIEQRIGRIDRIGQKSPKVYIHTLYYKGTVEEDVYNVCLERIEKSRSTIGHMQPILVAGDVEKIIRKSAMACTKEERAKVLAEMDAELGKSIAEVEESIRIFQFLNHYQPQLQLGRRDVPVSQVEMESALSPHLIESGWKKEGDYWGKGTSSITFNPRVLDQKDRRARLITPASELASIFGHMGALPERIATPYGEMRRVELDGTTGFLMKNEDGWHIITGLRDIKNPSGQIFSTSEETERHLRYIVRERKHEAVGAQIKSWNNRAEGWQARARMYLDRVLSYVWKEKGSPLNMDEGAVLRAWSEYLRDPDRQSTERLVKILSYVPSMEAARPKTRSRPIKASPRSSEREELLLQEWKRINGQLADLRRQESLLAERPSVP